MWPWGGSAKGHPTCVDQYPKKETWLIKSQQDFATYIKSNCQQTVCAVGYEARDSMGSGWAGETPNTHPRFIRLEFQAQTSWPPLLSTILWWQIRLTMHNHFTGSCHYVLCFYFPWKLWLILLFRWQSKQSRRARLRQKPISLGYEGRFKSCLRSSTQISFTSMKVTWS